MGIVITKKETLKRDSEPLNEEAAKIKIKTLIKKIDDELDSLLDTDMSPMESALLILLYRNHTEDVIRNASNKQWGWEKGSLENEYLKRRQNINAKRSISNTTIQKTTDKFIGEIKLHLGDDDPSISSDFVEDELDENNPELGSDADKQTQENRIKLADEKIKSYLEKQADKLFKQDQERSEEIINLLKCDELPEQSLQPCIDKCKDLHEQLIKDILKIHEEGHKSIKSQLRKENVKKVLDEFHGKQVKAMEEADVQRTKLVKDTIKQNVPASKDIVRKMNKDSPKHNLSDKDYFWIDEIIEILLKEGSNITDVKKCVENHLGKEKELLVNVDLERAKVAGDFANALVDVTLKLPNCNPQDQVRVGLNLTMETLESVYKDRELENLCYEIATKTPSPASEVKPQGQGIDGTLESKATNIPEEKPEAKEKPDAKEKSEVVEQSSTPL